MLKEWRKFKGWEVLEFFLKENGKIHLKALSRKLKISPRTAQLYLQLYEKKGILRKEKVGNMFLYSLNRNPLTLEFRKLYFLLQTYPHIKKFIKENPEINSLVLYGSHASGEYDNKSDIDLLVISQKKKIDLSSLKILEKRFRKEVKVQVFSVGEWRKLTGENDLFVISVLKNHVLLYGAEL